MEILQAFITFVALSLLVCAVAVWLGVYIGAKDYRRGRRG